MKADQRYAQQAGGIVEDVLDLMNGLIFQRAAGTGGSRVTPTDFSGALLIPTGTLAKIIPEDALYEGDDIYDLWPIRMRWLTAGHSGPCPAILNSLESVTRAQARGKVVRCFPKMLRVRMASIGRDRMGSTVESFLGLRRDGSLAMITNGGVGEPPRVDAQVQEHLRFAASLQLTLDYEWTVEIRSTGSNFSIKLLTTPHGARKLLSLRDIPPGRERRAALRHWVTEHRRSIGPEREVDVREHLRGAIPFKWEDMEGVVRPSPHDLRRAGQVVS